ncbi:MAG: DUF5667 domain-containing protein, partial [Candidatus Peribacteraceae bacterium]|nr:DUF5667 domain-containing protein [Candidatus Peribacteraceae bacterium]
MTPDKLLTGLSKKMRPNAHTKLKIKKSLQSRITTDSPLLTELQSAVVPKRTLQKTIWSRISSQIELPQADAFTRIKIAFQPSSELKEQIKARVLASLEPVQQIVYWPLTAKWTAAFALFGILVRISPMLFIASPTVADSEALLLPTRGNVYVSIEGMQVEVDRQMVLRPGMMIQTGDGEVTFVLNDDGAARLAPYTTVTINDVSDRLEAASEILPSITLHDGKLWMYGITPKPTRQLAVKTRNGLVAINEGSASIAVGDDVEVEVYDRSATIFRNAEPTFLTSGERVRLSNDSVLLVKKIPAKWFQYTWADQNLQRDAVHRHDIAQMQHERRIANAGILPTSRFYAVKRFAELMDVWLTFDQEARVQKQLEVAETRLNEAAALIYNGDEADTALAEYRDTLQAIAEGEHNGSLVEFLVQRAVAGSTAQMAAALPGDEAYVIKKTVLEASADLSNGIAREEDAKGTLLLDGLAVMVKAADEGRTDMVRAAWSDLSPYLLTLESQELALSPSMHKEAQTLLSFLATSLHVASNRGAVIDPELLDDIAVYLPAPRDTSVVVLSEEEVMYIVMTIKEKIFVYDMTKSRINQFIAEIRAIDGHPDAGRILRRLALALPE